MTHVYTMFGNSTKTMHCLRMLNVLKRYSTVPRRSFSSLNSANNRNFHCLRKNSINLPSCCKLLTTDVTTINDDLVVLEYETREAEITNGTSAVSDLKQLLYPDSNDPLIAEIIACYTVQDIFNLINKKYDLLNQTHLCQIILGLWEIQKLYSEEYIEHLEKCDIITSPEQMVNEFIDKLTSQEEFNKILQLVDLHCSSFSVKELCICMHYLRKLKLSYSNERIIKLIDLAEDKIKYAEEEWDLATMVQYTSSLKCKDSLRFAFHLRPTIPLILKFLSNSESVNDFKDVTTCMHNVHILLTTSMLEQHKAKLYSLTNSGIINSQNYNTIIRIMNFYNLLHWSSVNVNEISLLCKIIQPSIKNLNADHIISIHKVYQIHMTPGVILEDMSKRVTSLLEEMKNDDRIKTYLKLPDLLYCQVSAAPLKNKNAIEKISTKMLKSGFSSTYTSLYKTLRLLKTTNVQLCDLFWQNYIIILKDDEYEEQILQLCFRYMFFNNNLAGTYRNYEFETKMMNHLLGLKDGIFECTPWKFSRLAAFVIAYGNRNIKTEDFDAIVNKVIYSIQFLNPQEIFMLSRAVQINYSSNDLNRKSLSVSHLLAKINSSLDERLLVKISDENLSLNDINFLCKSYVCRHLNFHTEHFYKLLLKYDSVNETLYPRNVKDAVFNFLTTYAVVPSFLNKMVDFVASQKDDVVGEISQKVLQVCYYSGFIPENEDFFKYAIKSVERDQDVMSGISILDMGIAICYFGRLSESFVKSIFSLEFMERIDSEIANCYSKNNYPLKLRKQMMILNRAVCLDFPQYEIPWFHKKYIEEMISLSYVKRSPFHEDVLDILTSIIEKRGAIKNPFYSAYGYLIDFLLCLDKDGSPIVQNTDESKIAKRIAILLLFQNSHLKICEKQILDDGTDSISIQNVKRGSTQLRIRHLELLGYSIIEIPFSLWNSMHMAEPKAKINYLKNKIWNEGQ